jgi:hypothetical protein
MIKSWKTISVSASLAALLLVGVATTPGADQLQNGVATSQTTVASSTNVAAQTTTTNADTQKKHKSVLDADVLENPFSFFKDAATSDEDESDLNVKPSTVILALKALAATLLSTIM